MEVDIKKITELYDRYIIKNYSNIEDTLYDYRIAKCKEILAPLYSKPLEELKKLLINKTVRITGYYRKEYLDITDVKFNANEMSFCINGVGCCLSGKIIEEEMKGIKLETIGEDKNDLLHISYFKNYKRNINNDKIEFISEDEYKNDLNKYINIIINSNK